MLSSSIFSSRYSHRLFEQWANKTVFTVDFFNKAMAQPQYAFGPGRRYGQFSPCFILNLLIHRVFTLHDDACAGNWGTGADIRSMGFGKQVVMFNPVPCCPCLEFVLIDCLIAGD